MMENILQILGIIIALLVGSECAIANNKAILYYQRNYTGAQIPYDPTTTPCQVVEKDRGYGVTSISTAENCLHLYRQRECVGPYMIMQEGIPSDDLEVYGFGTALQSVGPCFPPCYTHLIRNGRGQVEPLFDTATIKIWGERPSYSAVLNINLARNTCRNIMSETMTWNNYELKALVDSELCIEIHQFADCTGDRMRLYLGSATDIPNRNQVQFTIPGRIKGALSFCDYNCKTTHNTTEEEATRVILFSMENFMGTRNEIIIPTATSHECITLENEWQGENTASTILVGNCIILYGDKSCSRKLKKLTRSIPNMRLMRFRSIKACDC